MELFKASQQWSTRPADETFSTMRAAYDASLAYRKTTAEKTDVNPASLRVEQDKGEILLVGKGNVPARLTHWSFGQLSARVGAPASYLRTLAPTLAAQNLNYGLLNRYGTVAEPKTDESVNILAHQNGSLLIRAFTSDKYTRIWNSDLLRRMLDFNQYGWTNPTPFSRGAGNKPAFGSALGEAHPTIYVSDHDMFVFQVNEQYRIKVPGRPEGLSRGFFVENSEVGASKLRITTFLFDYMCCNHIIWGAEEVNEVTLRHVGKVQDRLDVQLDRLSITLTKYANSSASDTEAKIASAQTKIIAANREEVIDKLFSKLRGDISRKALDDAYQLAAGHSEDGDPKSVWGMVSGITRRSQQEQFADARVAMDKAAGKLLEMAF